jgi:spermidine/putrescine transport system permease protein
MLQLGLRIKLLALTTFVFLYTPLVAVVVYSFNKSRFGIHWGGFSLDWYSKLIHDKLVLEACTNTVILALTSTCIATILGTALAIGLARFPWSKRITTFFDINLYLPVITPEIVFAGALVIAFTCLRSLSSAFEPGLVTMIIGHVTFQVAFVALVVRSRLASFNNEIEEAARDLYASNWYTFRHVLLPMMMPGIISGAMLALTLSLDDFIISFFTAGPTSVTLPLYIFGEVHRGITPKIHALSTIGLLVTICLVILSDRISKKHS